MATQPDPRLVEAMLQYRKTRDKDISQRIGALPGLAIAGAAGMPGSADNLLPKYDDPRQFELQKLQLKAQVLETARKAEQARMQGALSLAASMKANNELYTKMADVFQHAAGVEITQGTLLRKSVNDAISDMQRARISAAVRAGTGASSPGAMRQFMQQMFDEKTQSELPPQQQIRHGANEVEIQHGFAAGPDAQKGPETLVEEMYALDAFWEKFGGIDGMLAQNPNADGANELKQAWEKAKASGGGQNYVLFLSALADKSATDAIGQLYRDTPQSNWLGALDQWAKQHNIDPTASADAESFEKVFEQVAPKQQQQTNFGALSSALDEIDQLSPNLSPGSLKYNLLNSPMFQQWKQQQGFQTDEVAWRELRREVALKHSQQLGEDRANARARAFGGVTADSGPEQGALPLDAPGADRTDAAANDGLPKFYHNGVRTWYQSADGAEFRPATDSERAMVDRALEAGHKDAVITDPAAFTEAQKAAAGQAQSRINARQASRDAETANPQRPSPIPGLHATAAKIGFDVTHPSYAIQRGLGQLSRTNPFQRKPHEALAPPVAEEPGLPEVLPPHAGEAMVGPSQRPWLLSVPTSDWKAQLDDLGLHPLNGVLPSDLAPAKDELARILDLPPEEQAEALKKLYRLGERSPELEASL